MASQPVRKPEFESHLETTRLTIKTIVVAVDLSPVSEQSFRVAAELAKLYKSHLIVSHAIEYPDVTSGESVELERGRLAAFVDQRAASPALEIESTLLFGDLVEQIEHQVQSRHADLLVLGTHGAEGLEKFVLGSHAEALFRRIPIPVLTVGPHIEPRADGFRSILLPTDLTPNSLRAAQYAASLAEEYNSSLTVLHVMDEKSSRRPEAHREALRQMRECVPSDAELWCTPVFRTETGDPSERILAVAKATDADLIVMSVKHAPMAGHALWNTASQVVNQARCPVLTVRGHL